MKIFKKFRFYLRLSTAFLKKQQKIIFLGVLAGMGAFYLWPKLLLLLPGRNLKRIGLVGSYTPNELPLEIQNLISLGLTKIAADGSVQPALASSWETKNGGQEYLFHLQENLFWQDKSPLLAQDIDYHFSDVATSVADEKTVHFKLKEPFSPFPSVVSRPVFKKNLAGAGEYQVKKLFQKGQIVEKIILQPQDRALPSLTYHFYPNERAARMAFKLGEIDILQDISSLGELEEWPEVKISQEVKENRYAAVFLDNQNESLAEKSFRQGLAYAIQKKWEPRAFGPLDPNSWAYNEEIKPYDYNLESAKSLLTKSQDEGEAIALEEIELDTIPSLLETAEEIAKDWEKLGIKTKVRVTNLIPQDFQALLVTQEVPPDPDQYSFWHSTQATNLSHYKSPKVDKLLEDGRKTFDQEERKKIYLEFQKTIVEDTPAIFLFHPTLYTISRG